LRSVMNFMLALRNIDVRHYMEPLKVQLEGYGFSGLRCTSDCTPRYLLTETLRRV